MISNSGHDENNGYRNGKAGDQNGTEWNIINWYSRPWTCVLRYPDANVRNKIAELSEAAARNDNVGYDQYQRYDYWKQLQSVGFDPSKITVPCEADCSAGVIANTKATGYLLNIDALKNLTSTYTGNMRNGFKNCGFEVLTDKKYLTSPDYLLRGDILLNDEYHTATNLTNGVKSEQPNTNSGGTTNNTTNNSSSINKSVLWTGVVNCGELNVRTWCGTSNPTCSFSPLKRNYEVGVCDSRNANDGSIWYYIKYNDKYGFVHSDYISKKETSSNTNSGSTNTNSNQFTIDKAPLFLESIYGTYKTTDALNLRTGVGTGKQIICTIPKGGNVRCYGYYGVTGGVNWYYVVYGSQYGFVSSKYLKRQ